MKHFKPALSSLFCVALAACATTAQQNDAVPGTGSVYEVPRLTGSMPIDARWDKAQWRDVEPLVVRNFVREDPTFRPTVEAKVMYDDENLYVIWRVQDQFVRVVTTEIGGEVWKDSAVEFFFSPDTSQPLTYFNLEVNAGGTPLLGYRPKRPEVDDIRQIEIAHSLPATVDPEITEPVTWTLEYRIPLAMLEKYSNITRPAPGVEWKANFYKIAEINSNVHHATWSVVDLPRPTFHTPQFFGTLRFQ